MALPQLAVNGQLSLGENIADLGGTSIAFEAFQRSLRGKPAPAKIDGLTAEQRFYVSWAQQWRTAYRDDAMRLQVSRGPHAPGNFRAVGPLVNQDTFFKAFAIKEGDPMWRAPEQRAKIWRLHRPLGSRGCTEMRELLPPTRYRSGMKSPQSEKSSSPDVHRQNIMRELSQLIEHLEADTRRVKEPRFRGLLDKSAEVLKSLRSLFERYESGDRGARAGQEPAERSKKMESSGPSTARKGGGKAKTSRPRKEKMTTLTGEAAQKSATLTATPEPIVAAAKPVDPHALAALAQQQRKEARAAQMPAGSAAPRPTPPQSGKPVWSKPHSS